MGTRLEWDGSVILLEIECAETPPTTAVARAVRAAGAGAAPRAGSGRGRVTLTVTGVVSCRARCVSRRGVVSPRPSPLCGVVACAL